MEAAPPRAEESLLQRAIAAAGGPEAFEALWQAQSEGARKLRSYDWSFLARPSQLPPPGWWRTWMVRAGRGWGKTRVGGEFVRGEVEAGRAGRVALVARTAADARDVMVEGESGILAISPPWFRPKYEPSKRRLTWPNGAIATLYSAEQPDLLRGPQHDLAWCDELAAWSRLQETWDNLQFGLRLGIRPRVIITTTPRSLKFLKDIEAEPDTVVRTGSTYANRDNLAPSFFTRITRTYEGTRLGQQEIEALILDDNPNALWKAIWIESKRITVPEFLEHHAANIIRAVVAIDPATSEDPDNAETGIVCTAYGLCSCNGKVEEHGYVLEDVSGHLAARAWALAAGQLYQARRADRVIAETNQGGNLVESNLQANAETRNLAYKGVHAKDGKKLRAEPIAAIYEQRRVHHVGVFRLLETQMTQWNPKEINKPSPDRLDAAVHGFTELMLEPKTPAAPTFTRPSGPILPRRR
jgi:phage terminase large subunit-like protein